ncbi:MAG: lipid-binding SYLF domain-containing protein [Verrucomicrobiota bacterium]
MKSCKLIALVVLASSLIAVGANAASALQLQSDSQAALERLYSDNPKARDLGQKAYAILIFPTVVKFGVVMVGGQRGDGVLWENGQVAGYYNTTSASYGPQIGGQSFSYALFFMTKKDLKGLNKSGGFDLGGAPSLVVANKGVSGSASLYSLEGIKAFIFGQQGLMAGLGLQGTKISQYTPSN